MSAAPKSRPRSSSLGSKGKKSGKSSNKNCQRSSSPTKDKSGKQDNYNAALYKTELCKSWIDSGSCRYGHKCRFAHGEAELRPVTRPKKYKTEPCKTYSKTGSCPYGSRCRFIHDGEDPLEASSPGVLPHALPPKSAPLASINSTTRSPIITAFSLTAEPTDQAESSFTRFLESSPPQRTSTDMERAEVATKAVNVPTSALSYGKRSSYPFGLRTNVLHDGEDDLDAAPAGPLPLSYPPIPKSAPLMARRSAPRSPTFSSFSLNSEAPDEVDVSENILAGFLGSSPALRSHTKPIKVVPAFDSADHSDNLSFKFPITPSPSQWTSRNVSGLNSHSSPVERSSACSVLGFDVKPTHQSIYQNYPPNERNHQVSNEYSSANNHDYNFYSVNEKNAPTSDSPDLIFPHDMDELDFISDTLAVLEGPSHEDPQPRSSSLFTETHPFSSPYRV